MSWLVPSDRLVRVGMGSLHTQMIARCPEPVYILANAGLAALLALLDLQPGNPYDVLDSNKLGG